LQQLPLSRLEDCSKAQNLVRPTSPKQTTTRHRHYHRDYRSVKCVQCPVHSSNRIELSLPAEEWLQQNRPELPTNHHFGIELHFVFLYNIHDFCELQEGARVVDPDFVQIL
jgi:hypothetical protein